MAGLKIFLCNNTVVLLLFVVLVLSPVSSARPLNQFHQNNFMATDPGLNIAYQQQEQENVAVSSTEQTSNLVFPCDLQSARDQVSQPEKRYGKYGSSMVLNILRKGTVPPSGPSKGSNSVMD
ncbi:hypothetical protein IFM89_002743 [Coptis chinensis]|uniref:Uncharacterized protein n=1 Tax=Coptis chinensis TaxID=261450 RepID=A0A835IH55_9MAGN|nr:hypothetical protein IFM89_002743 [Coptis chinensis]